MEISSDAKESIQSLRNGVDNLSLTPGETKQPKKGTKKGGEFKIAGVTFNGRQKAVAELKLGRGVQNIANNTLTVGCHDLSLSDYCDSLTLHLMTPRPTASEFNND
jgi:hypothetical protein